MSYVSGTEKALLRAISEAHCGTEAQGARIANAVMDAIRNLKIPGLILWAQPEKTIECVQAGYAGPQDARQDKAAEG